MFVRINVTEVCESWATSFLVMPPVFMRCVRTVSTNGSKAVVKIVASSPYR